MKSEPSFILKDVFRILFFLLIGCTPAFSQLQNLAAVESLESRRNSSADPEGRNNDSWVSFEPGQTRLMLDTKGPGCIRHLWMTVSPFGDKSDWGRHETFLRDLVIRMYWENSPVPSVEVPLGDFFALGHARKYQVNSGPISVGQNNKALNCYWPMPFYRHAKIELFNNGSRSIRRIYYNLDYEIGPIPKNQALFHAEFRSAKNFPAQNTDLPNLDGKDNYVLLETEGKGQYVGCSLFVDADDKGWWGEGDEMIFIDQTNLPTIIGTGSEDYFCNAWGFKEPFCYPFYGVPFLEKQYNNHLLTTAYRFHIPDPVRFRKSIKVTIEHVNRKGIPNDYSSVAFWYQTEPVQKRTLLPKGNENHPRLYPKLPDLSKPFLMDGTALEENLHTQGISTHSGIDAAEHGGWLQIENLSAPLETALSVPQDGIYKVEVKPYYPEMKTDFRMGFANDSRVTIPRLDADLSQPKAPFVLLGQAQSKNQMISILIDAKGAVGIDTFRLELVPQEK